MRNRFHHQIGRRQLLGRLGLGGARGIASGGLQRRARPARTFAGEGLPDRPLLRQLLVAAVVLALVASCDGRPALAFQVAEPPGAVHPAPPGPPR